MLIEEGIRRLLGPFELELTSAQVGQVLTYLDLLLHWNAKINLTAIRTPEGCVTRHFGESLYLARWTSLQGNLLDVGSGAGFPGLVLRIIFPPLTTTLLEPVAKKRAFLKEVARACGIAPVEVRADRLEDYVRRNPAARFDCVTARAVGALDRLVPQAAKLLKSQGKLCLWVSRAQGEELSQLHKEVTWDAPIRVPLARQREIWIGTR
ncbi:MAG: 16S rRNA (guanine(527)-N(7))-methyltransferase RsmG [Terriglobia bacterium]|jgi:16S rRNA (guanine527-N7)-methyltransferase